jgi:hypothetical protein
MNVEHRTAPRFSTKRCISRGGAWQSHGQAAMQTPVASNASTRLDERFPGFRTSSPPQAPTRSCQGLIVLASTRKAPGRRATLTRR